MRVRGHIHTARSQRRCLTGAIAVTRAAALALRIIGL